MPFVKPIVVCILLLHIFSSSKAQTYAINNGFTFNETVTTCSGTFYDAGINGNYNPFESYVVTFCSGNIGKVMQFNFTEMSVGVGDTLFVYDGNSTNANILDTFTAVTYNSEFSVTVSDTSSTGCLTFKFTSDGSNQSTGWKALIKCAFQCKQKIQGTIATSPAKDANGYVNICLAPTGTVNFDLNTLFPNNDLIYHQSTASSSYHWYFGDGKDTSGKNVTLLTHTFTHEGGYLIRVTITDTNGCVNALPINVKVRTGISPRFLIQSPSNLCVGDTTRLTPAAIAGSSSTSGGTAAPQQGAFLQLPISSDSLFLPDGTGVTYTSNLFIDQFAQGQTLANISQLKGIFMNLEHSYLGDIDIAITAPNGVKVYLKSGSGAQDCFLGEPVDGNLSSATDNPALNNVRGKGYDYWFNTMPQYGTMIAESSLHTYTFVDNAGRTVTHKYLPSGSYTSAQSLNALVGTPLNGTWILQIKDWQSVDNGFLFGWHIEVDPVLYPHVETYNVPLVSQNWVTPANGIVGVTGTIATIVPPAAGTYGFVYRVVDGFGCNLDTTVTIVAKATPVKPNLGPDLALCSGQTSINLTVANPDGTAFYTWDNGGSGVAIAVGSPGTYIVTGSNSFGCSTKDTIIVGTSNNVAVSLGIDTFYCASKPNVLRPTVSSNVATYLWNDGSTADSLKVTGPGPYWVKGSTANGCNATANISLADNPVNSYAMPLDTVICANSSYFLTLSPPANTSIIWGDGVAGNTHLITGPATYSTTANNIGCFKQDSYDVTTKPLPIISLGLDTAICTYKTYLMRVAYPGASYLWNDNTIDSFLLAKGPGIYWVEALLNQCTYRDSMEVKYKKCDCETIFPNAFSPNGDGINELFAPTMQCVPINYQMSIFNRYGQSVFEIKDYQKGWDGKRNGQSLPIGTYYYIVTYFNNGLQVYERFTGSITLLR